MHQCQARPRPVEFSGHPARVVCTARSFELLGMQSVFRNASGAGEDGGPRLYQREEADGGALTHDVIAALSALEALLHYRNVYAVARYVMRYGNMGGDGNAGRALHSSGGQRGETDREKLLQLGPGHGSVIEWR